MAIVESYLAWVKSDFRRWGTWHPGHAVAPGDIGTFLPSGQFVGVGQSIGDLGMAPQLSPARNMEPSLYFNTRYWNIDGDHKAIARAVAVHGQADVRMKAARQNAHMMHILQGQYQALANEVDILRHVMSLILSGDWHPDWVLVCESVRAQSGFAIAGMGKSNSLSLQVQAGADVPDYLNLSDLKVGLAGQLAFLNAAQAGCVHQFNQNSTPVFSRVAYIDYGTWDWLLGSPRQLVHPSGISYPIPNYVPPEIAKDVPVASEDLAVEPDELQGQDPAKIFRKVDVVSMSKRHRRTRRHIRRFAQVR